MRSWTRLRGDLRTDADGLRIAEVMLDARRRQVLRRAVIAARARSARRDGDDECFCRTNSDSRTTQERVAGGRWLKIVVYRFI